MGGNLFDSSLGWDGFGHLAACLVPLWISSHGGIIGLVIFYPCPTYADRVFTQSSVHLMIFVVSRRFREFLCLPSV